MKTRYRYDRATGQMIGEDGMPMLNQSEKAMPPALPFAISDCQPALVSMTDGKIYDSKSQMRKEYKRAGVEEVGSEKPRQRRSWMEEREKRQKQREGIKASLHKAHSRLGFGAV